VKRLYGSDDRALIAHLRALLETRGIACVLRNEFLGGAAGELPPHECSPELWVVDDVDTTPWTCPGCGEIIEGQFARCWHCGREAPGDN
jgi:hypothetical protein